MPITTKYLHTDQLTDHTLSLQLHEASLYVRWNEQGLGISDVACDARHRSQRCRLPYVSSSWCEDLLRQCLKEEDRL